jgi:betaine lipid synthase
LDYEEFFALFGEGKLDNFRRILDSKLSPYLSSPAYQFWRIDVNAFNDSFYRRGYSGWAIRIAHWLFRFAGLSDDVKRLCEAHTIEEQDQIWKRSLRNLFVQGSVVRRLVDNPVFLWNALGVCNLDIFECQADSSVFTGSPEPKEGVYERGLCVRLHSVSSSSPNPSMQSA